MMRTTDADEGHSHAFQGFTVPKVRILKALATFRQLAVPQLARHLYSPGSLTMVRATVKRLDDAGLIYRLYLPREDGRGRGTTVCGLTATGASRARALGAFVPDGYHVADETRRAHSTLRHELAVRDVIISALGLRRANPRFTVADVVTEAEFRRAPGVIAVGSERQTIQPDAWLDLRHRGVGNWWERLPILVEVDRSGSQLTIRDKIDRYLTWTMAGYSERFGSGDARVVFVAAGNPKRATMLVRCIASHLKTRGLSALSWMFPVTAADPAALTPAEFWFGPVWRTDRSVAGAPLFVEGGVQDSHMGSFLHVWGLTEADLVPEITLYQRPNKPLPVSLDSR